MSHEASKKQTSFDVSGMSCDHCVRAVKRALGAIDGVETVDVHLADGKVDVVHDANAAPSARLAEAIRDAGYDATERA